MRRVARWATAARDILTAGNDRSAGSLKGRSRLAIVTSRPVRRRAAALLAVLAVLTLGVTAGCGRGDDAAADSTGNPARHPAFRSSVDGGYSVVPIASPGRVSGTITVGGDIPADTLVHPTSDVTTCGTELTDATIDHNGPLLAGAVVWLDGVRAGKALPLVRRYDVINEGCLVVPRVQAAVVGGTINVRSLDPVTHRTRLVRTGETKPVALVTETDEGQVVPLDHALEVAGQIEVSCDQHPWTRGYIAVFDHPYFAVTTGSGAFSFDSVPPGTYTLKVWHERLGVATKSVVVSDGGMATVDVELRGSPR
ncbi:MAG: carboxypeptidase regulatory-like domain-containing protein [Gemmatimonadaceae bacterium]